MENENYANSKIPLLILVYEKDAAHYNQFLYNENEKIYIKCNRTNEEGTACDQCIDGYELGNEGYCVNYERCEEKQDETCIRCRQEPTDILYFCANKYFGCLETLVNACVKCGI